MRTPEENIQLANILFPDVKETPEEVERRYPKRGLKEGEMVLRFAPSPTGFLHIGGVFMSLIGKTLVNQNGGVYILRIEDTDKTREISGGVDLIVKGLQGFGIDFDEGMKGDNTENGEYGPYLQSKRLNIYRAYAKDMVAKGNAYPCFVTEEELEEIRKKQEERGVRTGYYGDWAKWRDASFDDVRKELEVGKKFVIRLHSTGSIKNSFKIRDLIKGNVILRENDMDIVLLKSDSFPTYHFAHPIDDHLMRVTHVTRGDEWFASLPLHVEIFNKLGFELPQYCHFAPLMKMDNDGKSKRKLSKRKDPEADVQYYIDHGYPKDGVKEYLLNVANSNFYDWKIQNPGKSNDEFVVKLEKFNKSGALFDIVKLNDMCKDYIATLTAEQVYDFALEWAQTYDNEIADILEKNREYCISIFNIERTGERIRKDLVKFEDIRGQLDIFFDQMFEKIIPEDIADRIPVEKQREILVEYQDAYDSNDDQSAWFEKIKVLAAKLGFEKVGDVAMVLRVAITHRTKSPDLYQVMQVLGKELVCGRIDEYLSKI
jgi:glutamyl-tRNA synthetase